MRWLVAPLASGAFAAALLYGVLCASERRVPEPEDPWLDAWIGEGLKASFRSISQEPEKHALPSDAREEFAGAEFAGTVMRLYIVQNISVQVMRLPAAGVARTIPEGRSFEFRFHRQGNPIHVSRQGRTILFVSTAQRVVLGIGQMKAPRAQVEQIFQSFEETAKRYP